MTYRIIMFLLIITIRLSYPLLIFKYDLFSYNVKSFQGDGGGVGDACSSISGESGGMNSASKAPGV